MTADCETYADVTYRANRSGGGEAELRLALAPEAATVADAWARLSAAYGDVDPTSLEIEIREAARRVAPSPARKPAVTRPASRRPASSLGVAEAQSHR